MKKNIKKMIQDTFLDLYLSEDIENIKVSEICSRISIGRTTFYKYYKNVDEILNDLEKSIYDYFQTLKEKLPEIDIYSLKEGEIATNILEIYNYIDKNKKLFKAFFLKNTNHLIIIKAKKKVKENLKSVYYKYFSDQRSFDCFSEIVTFLLFNYSLIITDYSDVISIEKLTLETQKTIKSFIQKEND